MRASVIRRSHFNAAHRLHNPAWDDAKNKEVFGSCNNPHYHGHNYELDVKLTGEVDADTGYLYDLKELNSIIDTHIVAKLDHKNLNVEVAEFATLNPTAEHIAYVIYNTLRKVIDTKYDLHVTLWETPRNYVQYPV